MTRSLWISRNDFLATPRSAGGKQCQHSEHGRSMNGWNEFLWIPSVEWLPSAVAASRRRAADSAEKSSSRRQPAFDERGAVDGFNDEEEDIERVSERTRNDRETVMAQILERSRRMRWCSVFRCSLRLRPRPPDRSEGADVAAPAVETTIEEMLERASEPRSKSASQ